MPENLEGGANSFYFWVFSFLSFEGKNGTAQVLLFIRRFAECPLPAPVPPTLREDQRRGGFFFHKIAGFFLLNVLSHVSRPEIYHNLFLFG